MGIELPVHAHEMKGNIDVSPTNAVQMLRKFRQPKRNEMCVCVWSHSIRMCFFEEKFFFLLDLILLANVPVHNPFSQGI